MTAGRVQRLSPTPEIMGRVREYKQVEERLNDVRAEYARQKYEIQSEMDQILRAIVSEEHGSGVLAGRLFGISDVQVSRRLRDALVRAIRHGMAEHGVSDDDYELVFHTGNRAIGLVPLVENLHVSEKLAGVGLVVTEERFRIIPKNERDKWSYLKGALAEVRTALASAGISPRAYRITKGNLTFMVHPTKDGVLATVEDALRRGVVTVPYTITDVVTFVLPAIESGPSRQEFVVTWR